MDIATRKNDYLKYLAILPLLPLTVSVRYTLVGVVVLGLILFVTTTVLSLLSKFSEKNLYAGFVLLLSVFVFSIMKMVLISMGFNIVDDMGVYLSIIPVNASILYLHGYYVKNDLPYTKEWFGLVLSFLLIVLFSVFRELLGTGSIDLSFRISENVHGTVIDIRHMFSFLSSDNINYGFVFLILPSGGFIFLGLFIGLFRAIKSKLNNN